MALDTCEFIVRSRLLMSYVPIDVDSLLRVPFRRGRRYVLSSFTSRTSGTTSEGTRSMESPTLMQRSTLANWPTRFATPLLICT